MPGTPRELALDEAADLARIARAAGTGDRRPAVVAITADATAGPSGGDPGGLRPGRRPARRRRTDRRWPGPSGDGHGRSSRCRRPSPTISRLSRRTSSRAVGPTWPPGSTGSCSTRPAARTRAGPGRARRNGWRRPSPASCRSSSPGGLVRGERRGRAAVDPGHRRGRRLGRRAAADRRRPADQGPAPRRPLRQACPGRPRRPAEHRVRADPDPRRPARRRRRRPVGDGARLRWPLRPRDADGRPRAARDAYDGAPPGPGLLGRAPRAAGHVRRPPDLALPGRPPGRRRPRGGRASGRPPRAADPRRSGST